MAFELQRGETPRQAVRRIVGQQLESALDHSEAAAHGDFDKPVHEMRKSLKRVRSLLRLVRSAIGESAYRFENDSLRDVARPLSALRDAKVLSDALTRLREPLEETGADQAYEQTDGMLAVRRRRVHAASVIDDCALDTVQPELESALERISDWTQLPKNWQPFRQGLKRTYRKGRDAYRQAKADPTAARLHQWRKQVKYLRHQLEVLSPTRPKAFGELAGQAQRLGELLGEDHDLAVLAQVLAEDDQHELSAETIDALHSVIAARRQQCCEDAMAVGELLYGKSPKRFARPLKRGMMRWHKRSGAPRVISTDK